jgi:hypothetical protein
MNINTTERRVGLEAYRVSPASIVSPHVEEPGIDILVDFRCHGYLVSIRGTLEPVVFDGDLLDVCVYRDNFILFTMRMCVNSRK